MEPVRELENMYKYCIFVIYPKVEDNVPDRLFQYNFNCVKPVNGPNELGIVPVSSLKPNWRLFSFVRYPISDGIVPVIRFSTHY